jgi:transposase InsO family protein
MTDPSSDLRHEVALFRYGLIAEFVREPPGTPGLYARLEEKALQNYTIPGTTRTRVAAETLRDWIKLYRQGGFDALLPKARADRGRSRALPAEVAEQLLGLKETQPKLSVRQVIARVLADGTVAEGAHLPPSTVHRLFVRHGLMDKSGGGPSDKDRRRFAFERAGQLWMSDVMHGPSVAVDGKRRGKAYLIAFLDDATRVVSYAAFALSENTQAFLPVLKQALLRRGLPERLYVDNGANYRSRHLALVCAKLGVALIHARPYQPQGKGKIERFFRTVRAQLLPGLGGEGTASLEALNRRLWAWVEGEYHHSPHRGLEGETPLERWARTADSVRFPEPEMDLDDLFLFEAVRKVQKDRTVSLDGVLYEVDAALVGEKVTLRYDPATARRGVQICHQGRFIETAKPVDLYANCFVKRDRPSWNLTTEGEVPAPTASGLRLAQCADGEEV